MEVNTVKEKLRSNQGSLAVTAMYKILFWGIIITVVTVFFYSHTMATKLADYMQQSVLQTAATNAYNAYAGVRQGTSSAHAYAGNNIWNEMVSTAEVSQRLADSLGLVQSGNNLYKMKDGSVVYGFADMTVYCSNVGVGTDNSTLLTFTAKATIEMRYQFMGIPFTIRIPIGLTSYYTPLF